MQARILSKGFTDTHPADLGILQRTQGPKVALGMQVLGVVVVNVVAYNVGIYTWAHL